MVRGQLVPQGRRSDHTQGRVLLLDHIPGLGQRLHHTFHRLKPRRLQFRAKVWLTTLARPQKYVGNAGRVSGLAKAAANVAVPLIAAYQTFGDDGIKVQGNRSSDPNYDEMSGMPRVGSSLKELALRAGDWGTRVLIFLVGGHFLAERRHSTTHIVKVLDNLKGCLHQHHNKFLSVRSRRLPRNKHQSSKLLLLQRRQIVKSGFRNTRFKSNLLPHQNQTTVLVTVTEMT